MWMRHRTLTHLTSVIDETSFRLVWEPRGWERFQPEPPPAVDVLPPPVEETAPAQPETVTKRPRVKE